MRCGVSLQGSRPSQRVKQRDSFLGNRAVRVFESKGRREECPRAPSPVLQSFVHLEYAPTCPCAQGSSEDSFSPQGALSMSFLRHRDSRGQPFPVFLFWSETSCPSKLYPCSGSQLPSSRPPSLSFLPFYPRGEFGIQISTIQLNLSYLYLLKSSCIIFIYTLIINTYVLRLHLERKGSL